MPNPLSQHPIASSRTFAEVVLPLAIPKVLTYYIPENLIDEIQFGIRVEVPFGKSKLYSGIVVNIHQKAPQSLKIKSLLSVIDQQPIINQKQWAFWQWLAAYYCCTPGEVMHAALPANLKLASETSVRLSPLFDGDHSNLTDNEYLIAEALTIQDVITVAEIQKIVNTKSTYYLISSLLAKKVIYLEEELKEKFRPKTTAFIQLNEPYASQSDSLQQAFDKLKNSDRQEEALMAFLLLSQKGESVKRAQVCKKAQVDSNVISAIEKKGIWKIIEREISRIEPYENETNENQAPTPQQMIALSEIAKHFENKQVVLLHGVTGSGKTRIYTEFIEKALEQNRQALYLLPEIALTGQLISRLQKIFGDRVAVYHSKLNNNERVEVWQQVAVGASKVILGARSALFLPFSSLEFIIVDEEHDTSYKQQDPAPRYHGRDAAIFLAHLFGSKTILGTATPSFESFMNAKKGKYGLVTMSERYGGIELPKLQIADISQEIKEQTMHSIFTSSLIQSIQAALDTNEQVILFQNRRGFAPSIRCEKCQWYQLCIHCEVSLTYHKFLHHMQCHYCGYTTQIPKSCPTCGSYEIKLQGFGTEKIEDELKIYFPEAKIGRLDLDAIRGKNAHTKIIQNFEDGKIDILVGTQMVTKGLDFDNVSLVGIVSADQLFQFPDFRASERGFQLIAQVAGRAGRKNKQGKVIIQAKNVAHPVISDVVNYDFESFYAREIQDRQSFFYPPFSRLIRITLKHQRPDTVNHAAKIFAECLKPVLGKRVLGPAVPHIGRLRGQFLLDILIKMENNIALLGKAKQAIWEASAKLHQEKGYSAVRVNVDVDPM